MMIKDLEGNDRFSLTEHEVFMLDRIKEKITKEDQEVWGCFGGDTGCGKSLRSMWWMYYLTKELGLSQVCFDKDEFIDAVLAAKPGTGVIADEAISMFFSRANMTKEGRQITELANQIRQKNLAIFLNVPNVCSIDTLIQEKLNFYAHVWESRKLTGKKKETIKGNAAIYPEFAQRPMRTMIISYLKKKRRNPLKHLVRPAPFFTIPGSPIGPTHKKPWYPVDEVGYRAKKESVLHKNRKTEVIVEKRSAKMVTRDKTMAKGRELGVSTQILSKMWGLGVRATNMIIKSQNSKDKIDFSKEIGDRGNI